MLEIDYYDTLAIFSQITKANLKRACEIIGRQSAQEYFETKKAGGKGEYYRNYKSIVDIQSFSDKFRIIFKVRLSFIIVSKTSDTILHTLLVDRDDVVMRSSDELEKFISELIEEENTRLEIESYSL